MLRLFVFKKNIVQIACVSVIIAVFCVLSLFANEQYFDGILVRQSDENTLDMALSPEWICIDTILIDGEPYLLPNIKGCTVSDKIQIGSPIELIRTATITVPDAISFNLERYFVAGLTQIIGNIAPKPNYVLQEETYKTEYLVNDNLYSSYVPSPCVSVEYMGIAGCRHIAKVTFVVAKYYPADKTIEIPSEINVKINFTPQTTNSNAFAKNDIETTINHNETRGWIIDRNANKKNGNTFQAGAVGLDEISDGQWIRLGIVNEGLYTITAADLAAKGINIPKEKVNTIKIYGQSGEPMSENHKAELSMNEQAIIVKTSDDGSLSSVMFYASGARGLIYDSTNKIQRHYNNYYDTRNYYLFTYGKTEGKRATAISTPTGEVKNKPISYKASLFFEEDKYMPQEPGSGLIWLGEPISNNTPIINSLPNFNRSGNVEYVVSVAHTASSEQYVKVYEGNELLGNITLSTIGGSGSEQSASIYTKLMKLPANKIASDNRSILKFDYTGSPLNPFHNFYEIHYQSDLLPINNDITFFSDIVDYSDGGDYGLTEYSINNFNSANGNTSIYGFDVTDMSNPILLTNIANTGGFFIFRSEDKPTNVRKYFISSKTNMPTIDNISLENLRSISNSKYSNVDVIVITPEAFMETAKAFAEYRSKQSGLKVSVVSVNKIYDEFSYCRLDLGGIRDYIQYCYENWANPPSYIVLWGTGTYDYRGIEPYPNYLPAHERVLRTKCFEPFGSNTINSNSNNYASDDYFVAVVGDDMYPDIAIGRVPLSSDNQGYEFIEKLDLYENHSNIGNWRRNVLLLADDGPTTSNSSGDGTQHVNNAEVIARYVANDMIVNKVYIVEYPVLYQSGGERRIPKASEALMNQLNVVGNTAFIYSGHGNTNILTHERTFTRDMLQQFTNSDKMFLFGAASCEVGRFDQSRGTLGADIVLHPKAGAIASFSATRVSYGSSNTAVMSRMLQNLAKRDAYYNFNTLGKASRLTKSSGDSNNENFMYVLLGDPTMRLVHPSLDIVVEEINGTKIVDNTTNLDVKAMTYLNIKGKIVSSKDNSLQTDFNGIVNILLNEPLVKTKVIDDWGTNFNFIKNGATLNSSSYNVADGLFEAEFIIPADIGFSQENSLLYFYAASADSTRFAKGINQNLFINSIETNIPNDLNGPDMTLKLDKKSFVSGDMVSKNPLLMLNLWDETGINTTGLGIGHKIEAWIDDSPNPIDLTSNFTSSLTDSRGGEINKVLYGIPAGTHKIKARAWDVFNNYSEVETYFIIPENKEETILGATFCPNPAQNAENIGILINYNITPPISATITIIDGLGQQLTVFDRTLANTGYSIVNCPQVVALHPGAYYYRIRFKFDKTSTTARSGEVYGPLGTIVK